MQVHLTHEKKSSLLTKKRTIVNMEFYLSILALTIIFVYMLKHFLRKTVTVSGQKLPGPKQWPLLGNMHQVDMQHLHQSVSTMVKDFGPIFQLNLMGQKTVLLNDPELIRKAFGSSEIGDVLKDFDMFKVIAKSVANSLFIFATGELPQDGD